MSVSFQLESELEDQLRRDMGDLAQAAREAIDGGTERRITLHQLQHKARDHFVW